MQLGRNSLVFRATSTWSRSILPPSIDVSVIFKATGPFCVSILFKDESDSAIIACVKNRTLTLTTETINKSFFHRIVSEWNSFPTQIRDSTSVNSFKQQLMLHYKLKLQQSFNVNDLYSWTSTCRCHCRVCNRMKYLLL